MPHDSTAEGPSEFRAIVFITEELGKFLALFFGGFTHAWGVKESVSFLHNIDKVHSKIIGLLQLVQIAALDLDVERLA
jgi:hypothetical protein